ncbi:hypothetical protein [Pseudodesulfovibrio sp.]|uniref:hypothetical protein n=1 Tax=Pseudodesulfovibrio sp. TaxID=2035812 RepID=UPI0026300513|nr:hypothetical protein [Pseudodesulfovibrio sp.]MDD3312398.1 hypothetical protein [Pseudodesulfovibrio sp.]
MRGCVFLQGADPVQRHLAHGAFGPLCAAHDVTFVALRSAENMTGELILAHAPHPVGEVVWVPHRPERMAAWAELFNISCIRHRDRSPSFRVRHEESRRADPERYARYERLARPEHYRRHVAETEAALGLHPELTAALDRLRPEFIVLPSLLLDSGTDDLLQAAEALDIPVLLLQTGWDNLCSKGLLLRLPTLMGVWGRQSLEHAVTVQDMPRERVRIVGAPHFDAFRHCREARDEDLAERLGLRPGVPSLLFAGTLRYFDETALLRELDERIERGDLPAMRVVYRPHPWRLRREHEENFLDLGWRNVVMDPEREDSYGDAKRRNTTITSRHRTFSMHYLARLYSVLDAVASPMSSILLESMAAGLPIMATAFGDGVHSWSADKVSRMMHFEDWFKLDGVMACRGREEFFGALPRLLAMADEPGVAERLRAAMQPLVMTGDDAYGDRVLRCVGELPGRFRPLAEEAA